MVLCHAAGQYVIQGRASGALKAVNGEWVFPELIATWLKQQQEVQDAEVKPGQDLMLTIYIDTPADFYPLAKVLAKQIKYRFGPEYSAAEWKKAKITRSALGKIVQIDPIETDYDQ